MPGWEPILPKKPIIDPERIRRRLHNEFDAFLIDTTREFADYDPPPSLTYVRTNTLKRSWSKVGPKTQGRNLVGEVRSSGNIAPYNVYVRGPETGPKGKRQAERMHARGWRNTDEIIKLMWPPAKRRIQRILKGGR